MKLEDLREKSHGNVDLVGSGDNLVPRELTNPSFATNLINRCFGYVDWRPDYYVCTDKYVLGNYAEDVRECIAGARVSFLPTEDAPLFAGNIIPISILHEPFDGEVTDGIYGHGTTLSVALKLAHFMGFPSVTFRNCDLYMRDKLHFYGEDPMNKLSADEIGFRRARAILAHAEMIEFCGKRGMKVRYL